MESYIPITFLNDFSFCPRSIYFHNIYQENYNENTVHKTWQKEGQAAHKSIDEQSYTSRKDVLQGLSVYSVQYGLMGKIDLFDQRSGVLTERKNSVTAVYPGFRYQIYAQYYSLCEMGYKPRVLRLHSKKSNQAYPISIPSEVERAEFEQVIQELRDFSLEDPFSQNIAKCRNCIYNPLCDYYKEVDL
tara:strand:- start:803 stop:1366 length:564 start_codon:yes stop_codon:yes gene_type:complete